MARWVKQSEISSITNHSRRRTAYLLPSLGQLVVAAIKGYFTSFPNGEEVTLAVLADVGQARLRAADPNRSLDRLKQDLGLLTAQTVVDLYGPTNVSTFRENHGEQSSTRRNTWKHITWVNRYTPHRVHQISRGQKERIILDASAVRDFIEEGESAFPLNRIVELKGTHRISIGNSAYGELFISLLKPDGGMDFSKWKSRVDDLIRLLDPDLPIAPGGYDLAALVGAIPGTKIDPDATKAYYKAIWLLLSEAKSVQELTMPARFVLPTGAMFEIRMDFEKALSVQNALKIEWAKKINLFSSALKEWDQTPSISPTSLGRIIQSSLAWGGMPVSLVDKFSLVAEVIAARIWESMHAKSPYNPEKRANDVFDFDLLFSVAIPAWVCSTDKKFVNVARSTKSRNRMDVMLPDQLVDRLQAEMLMP